MCGRFTLFSGVEEINRQYQLSWKGEPARRYNIAPTQSVLAIIQDEMGKHQVQWLRWGLIPFWAKEPSIGNRLINARAETIDEKPSFRHLLSRKRCIILTNGFFEWKPEGNDKQPYFIRCMHRNLFSFAGLWDCWQKGQQTIYSCTIITTEANESMKSIHHRMPVLLNQEQEAQWMDQGSMDRRWAKSLLRSVDHQLEMYPVSTLVNHPRNDRPEVIKPLN